MACTVVVFGQKQMRQQSLEGKWTITFMLMEGKLSDVSDKGYKLEFRTGENRMGAQICNRMGGSYISDGNIIKFGQMFSTKMMCPDMAYETAFGNALMQVNNFSFEENRMLLKNGNDTLMILSIQEN